MASTLMDSMCIHVCMNVDNVWNFTYGGYYKGLERFRSTIERRNTVKIDGPPFSSLK